MDFRIFEIVRKGNIESDLRRSVISDIQKPDIK